MKRTGPIISLLLILLASGCASTQLRQPVTIQVKPQVERIALDEGGLIWRLGCAFEDAVLSPQTRVGDRVVVGALNSIGPDPHGGVAMLPFIALGTAISGTERVATFAANLSDLDSRGKKSTVADEQLIQAAQNADMRTMFAKCLPLSGTGDVTVVVRSVIAKTNRRTTGTRVTVKVELVQQDGRAERVLRKYACTLPYKAEHPDLVATRRTPTRTIEGAIAKIAAEIAADFKVAGNVTLAGGDTAPATKRGFWCEG